ncbi:MAG: response regulator transcription factor [Chloroflexi bacterium]|nr:response regulator transcription factor [Chloroflexota bacterium]
MDKIRILLCDDHAMVRQGIAALVAGEPDMEVVAQVTRGEDAVSRTIELVPDVVLMDIGLPGINGLEATSQIIKSLPQARVLILTVHDREDYLFRGLKAGACGYVLKGADVNDLLAAIRVVHAGEMFIYPSMTRKLVADYVTRAQAGEGRDTYNGLTAREREVLHYLADGKTAGHIAEMLHLSPHTVRSHRENLMKKLNLHSKAEVIKYALRHGFLDSGS